MTYRFTLASGEKVAGAVLTRNGMCLPAGLVGAIKADLVHAELGLALVNLQEPMPGFAVVVEGPDSARVVRLAGAEVSA